MNAEGYVLLAFVGYFYTERCQSMHDTAALRKNNVPKFM